MTNSKNQQSQQPGMLYFVKDLPNICSLAGLLCAVLAIYFAILKNFPLAMTGLIWAVLFDWGDGIIARKLKGRTKIDGDYGAQLDSLIDMISFGICPAVLLLSYGNFSPWFLPGAFIITATSAIRLSYFNVFGLVDDSTYMGLALDNNVIIVSFIFLFEGFFSTTIFSVVIYLLFIVLAVFNLAPVKTPKFAGRWFYVLIAYTVVLTFINCWILLRSI